MGNQAASRFGQDGPSRITVAPSMLLEASQVMPNEPVYQPVIPFYPAAITNGDGTSSGGSTIAESLNIWRNTPSRCDLLFYQGDDVTVTLVIEDPADSTPDMSTEWGWSAQIRVFHTHRSTLINTFSVKDEYFPPVEGNSGYTLVTMFLPRSENTHFGTFNWDLYSKAPLDGADFPQPPDVIDPEPWPPTDQIRTWLYGEVKILPRVTSTDVLNTDPEGGGTTPPSAVQPQFVISSYGPNGRIP